MEKIEFIAREYKPQSHKWESYRVFAPESWWKNRSRCRLRTRRIGNCLEIEVTPALHGEWQAWPLDYSGQIEKIIGEPLLALADQGGWSGGRNYLGLVFLRAGQVVQLDCKGNKKFIYVPHLDTEIVCSGSPPQAWDDSTWETR